jgi:hypothetical protein
MKKLLKYLGFAFIGFIILGIIAVATDDSQKTTPSSNKKTVQYTIAKKDESPGQINYRVIIPERVDDKEALIEIVRKLKDENNWKEKLVCFFEIKVHSESNAWASCAYLPQCAECETDKDADGNPVQFHMIGMTRSFADSLQQKHLDTIENKQLVAAYLEDISKCKTELYKVDKHPSKLLMGQIFNDGFLVQWLTLKKVNGQERYYFDDEADEDEKNYLMIDNRAKNILFFNETGKNWQALGLIEG